MKHRPWSCWFQLYLRKVGPKYVLQVKKAVKIINFHVHGCHIWLSTCIHIMLNKRNRILQGNHCFYFHKELVTTLNQQKGNQNIHITHHDWKKVEPKSKKSFTIISKVLVAFIISSSFLKPPSGQKWKGWFWSEKDAQNFGCVKQMQFQEHLE